MTLLDAIMTIEAPDQDTTRADTLRAWSHIAETGAWRNLQGFYGRTVDHLIDTGMLSPNGEITDLGRRTLELE